jgi:hypothetical protein
MKIGSEVMTHVSCGLEKYSLVVPRHNRADDIQDIQEARDYNRGDDAEEDEDDEDDEEHGEGYTTSDV